MDLREKKTKRSITNAFLRLRSQKPLERITVKELAELAEISKATFYLHYRDIFDLSDALQEEVIQSILTGIPHPETCVSDPVAFSLALCHAFYAQQNLIETLFSGAQSSALPTRIEEELQAYIPRHFPEADHRLGMLLTYQIQGSYCVYQKYQKDLSMEEVLRFTGELAKATTDRYRQVFGA